MIIISMRNSFIPSKGIFIENRCDDAQETFNLIIYYGGMFRKLYIARGNRILLGRK